MSNYRDDVCVDGEASETDDEDTHPRSSKTMQSSYRDDNCVDGEASETDDEEESGRGAGHNASTSRPNHLDVSGIPIIEKIEDLPPSHPFLTTTWRAMTVAADNQRVKNRRKHLVEARKVEKEVEKRFAALQHSGRAIRPATDALLNIEVMFEKLAQNCDEILKNRRNEIS
ncbi:hypothetical protein PRIPAC_86016 [Pristionchus pacificus]|uniref:Biogenesis of lysosome-related organelles complex 1 subunit 3 n=1 Tax=Pristionchus pacificus TaxID=54126 RepID=A0A2A6BT19_PRIPA|nr:hypothetical protein PRIPAC_86016 [Pristionchus pacificus]|eukprot:PDM68911.1 hypothetical protein PRIPAC_47213 [Pristionchus pacificus]